MDRQDTFSTLVQTLAQDETAPEAMRAARLADAPPPSERTTLETLLPASAPSATPISDAALSLIVAAEVSSRAVYEAKLTRPTWPKGQSGVTIGIGYDVGTVSSPTLASDWHGRLNDVAIGRLSHACGVLGANAATLVAGLSDITVEWEIANAVFRQTSVPVFVGLTERSLPNTHLIGPDCLGALVSLVYNRGASFQRPEDRFREMRAIRQHMTDRRFELIPGELRSMKRIWEGEPNSAGLLVRREAEAQLFERGLAHLPGQAGA